MEELGYGKELWSDAQPKNSGVGKTALLLLTVIFVLNGIASSAIYFGLAALTGLAYAFAQRGLNRATPGAKIYENGILAFASEDGPGHSSAKERFFRWQEIRRMKTGKIGGLLKRGVLWITCAEGAYSVNLEKKDGFASACKKIGKTVGED
jgi:hypothetical protein